MPRVIADIISPEELIIRFNKELEETTSSSSYVAKILGDRIRQIINQGNDYLDDELQDCFHDAAIILATLPTWAQRKIKGTILSQKEHDLDLSLLHLTDDHVAIIADLLYFTGVTSLDVSNNDIGNTGAFYLAKNTTLSNINLSNNKISDQVINYFDRNTTLSNLTVSGNKITRKGQRQINGMLARNIRNITIAQNQADFRNEVRTIGEGLRNGGNFFSNLPGELTFKIVDMLAKEHGLFAHNKREEVINNNLFPECKRDISQP